LAVIGSYILRIHASSSRNHETMYTTHDRCAGRTGLGITLTLDGVIDGDHYAGNFVDGGGVVFAAIFTFIG
jgi:hypothetical protein